MKKIIKLWALVSLLLSMLYTATGSRFLITHRFPFLVVDMAYAVASGPDYGYDHRGEYIAFDYDVQPHDRILAAMIYNPLSNYSDDIIARFDF